MKGESRSTSSRTRWKTPPAKAVLFTDPDQAKMKMTRIWIWVSAALIFSNDEFVRLNSLCRTSSMDVSRRYYFPLTKPKAIILALMCYPWLILSLPCCYTVPSAVYDDMFAYLNLKVWSQINLQKAAPLSCPSAKEVENLDINDAGPAYGEYLIYVQERTPGSGSNTTICVLDCRGVRVHATAYGWAKECEPQDILHTTPLVLIDEYDKNGLSRRSWHHLLYVLLESISSYIFLTNIRSSYIEAVSSSRGDGQVEYRFQLSRFE
ncbi:hypothetical protein RJ641_000703 [Dillenia turbinata]|uniref:Uncharacterized protein n=1 Tax=Dillenia turbinata TaxID=194707 RepID=A0AAN8W8N2_9MAGN